MIHFLGRYWPSGVLNRDRLGLPETWLPPKILLIDSLELDQVQVLRSENEGVIFSCEGETVSRQRKTKLEPYFALRRAHGRILPQAIDSDDDEYDLVYRLQEEFG